MKPKSQNLPEIILCGYERGGTTVLSELFRSNKYESGFECGVLMCKQPYDFIDCKPYVDMLSPGWGIDPSLIKSVCKGSFEFFYAQLTEKSSLSFLNKRVFDKTPIYMKHLGRALHRTGFINKACVIHRDPRSVFVSWAKRRKRQDQSIEQHIAEKLDSFCAHYLSYFIGSAAHMESANVLFIPFEDFVTREHLYCKAIGIFATGSEFVKRNTNSRFENVKGNGMDSSKVFEYKKHLTSELQEEILNKTQLAATFFGNSADRGKYGQHWIDISNEINSLLCSFKITYLHKEIGGIYFEPFTYLLRYPDILKAKVNPEKHFANHGIGEGRRGA